MIAPSNDVAGALAGGDERIGQLLALAAAISVGAVRTCRSPSAVRRSPFADCSLRLSLVARNLSITSRRSPSAACARRSPTAPAPLHGIDLSLNCLCSSQFFQNIFRCIGQKIDFFKALKTLGVAFRLDSTDAPRRSVNLSLNF
ncbi:hypothetical protein [Massilia rubra]|uniref:Uncharacterized protein n=1 Tax=Massilia rubra TaxID=2607910 RepID=A0ABX0M1C9_9BURK|nr:hypothetical protein [Massilia rubra]NHZ36066.1 hypothetical protein [Massilia rubra]